eukprot:SAG11_NODE_7416_length_1147_cov_1.393130_1_plen_110_part_00
MYRPYLNIRLKICLEVWVQMRFKNWKIKRWRSTSLTICSEKVENAPIVRRNDGAERVAKEAQDLCDQAHTVNARNAVYERVEAKLDAAGEPSVLKHFAESIDDGRLLGC